MEKLTSWVVLYVCLMGVSALGGETTPYIVEDTSVTEHTVETKIDYTIVFNETSEINLSNVPTIRPAVGSVTTPITHQKYFLGERELFDYRPRFMPNAVAFDLDNRPYIRVGKRADEYDLFDSPNATLGVIQTTDDNGNWIELNTFLPAIKAMYPIWNGLYRSGVSVDERVVFDGSGDAYMIVHTNTSNLGFNVLLHSKDKCRTWKVYPLSSNYYFTKWEVPEGNNDTDKPPVLLVYPYGFTGNPIYMIVPQKTESGNLVLPVVTVTPDPQASLMPNVAGWGNSTVSKGNLIHVVYMSIEPIPGNTGTPIYIVTYDRNTGTFSNPILIALSNNIYQPDVHDGPAITIDSQGYLHVVIGAHHDSFKYTKSQTPNSSTSGWTTPMNLGRPEYAGWTYVGLLCDKNDTLHVVGRNAGYGYYFSLWYMRKTAGESWEDLGPLVMPFRGYYSNWYHQLSLDRQNRLFLNYIYYGDQYDRGSDYTYEIDAYKAKWPWESPYLIDPENDSWGGIQGHDPCMIMSDDGGGSWRIALSTSLQLFFNNTFDNSLDGWTLTNHSSTNPIKTLSSYTYNGKTILPRTGSTMAVSERSENWKMATRTLAVPQSGIFTSYINMAENTDVGMISISTPGHVFMVKANFVQGKVLYRIDETFVPTTINVTPQTWHEVKFIVGSNGVKAYWDGVLLFHSTLGTKISSMTFGSAWTSAPCGYDDFSFIPLPVLPGDSNGDGLVDVGDLGILAANYGGTGKTWTQGDFNGDGMVDVGDLGILAAHYGTGVNGSLDFDADYAKTLGTAAEENDSGIEDDLNKTFCYALGLPLMVGLLLAGLMLMKS